MKYFLGKTIGFVEGAAAMLIVSFGIVGFSSLKTAIEDSNATAESIAVEVDKTVSKRRKTKKI